jgi:arginine utilization protein RocB
MTRSSADLAARAKELALLLTSWPSVTGTADEAAFGGKLLDHLHTRRSNRFDELAAYGVQAGTRLCPNIFALKRGRTGRTIVLTGHFDTVPFDDYGALADFALQPEALTQAIINRLRQNGQHAPALSDLESGAFIAGRGLLDMKAGLAAGLAAMEAYAGDMTLLFIAICDEEEKSAGARAAAPELRRFAEEHDLQIELIINLDAISDQGDGSQGRVVAFGSIGKQLLTAFVSGKQTHAGYPQDGVNAAYVAAELVTEFELSTAFSENTGDEVAAPPTALHAKDMKQGYNVTTPGQAWVYWNTMQHRRSGSELLGLAMDHARRAIDRAQRRTGHTIDLLRFSELQEQCGKTPTPRANIDLPEQSRLATASTLEGAGVSKPTVVMGFGSIPYPAVLLRNQALRQVIEAAVQPFGLGKVNYFAGISDMSFFGEMAGDLSIVEANTPIWGTGFTMPEPTGYPCINIGPWGRDYHTWLERLHAPYAFETLPRVLLAVIEAIAQSR